MELTPVDLKDIPKRTRAINPNAVPAWAQELIKRVCADYGVSIPPVRWRKRSDESEFYSSGSSRYKRKENTYHTVCVTAGSDLEDQRQTVLHELAHWMLPVGAGHNAAFWRRCWELFVRYGVDLDQAYHRSKRYRSGSVWAAPDEVRKRNEGVSFTVVATEVGWAALKGLIDE